MLFDIGYSMTLEERKIMQSRQYHTLCIMQDVSQKDLPNKDVYCQQQLGLGVVTAAHNGRLYDRYMVRAYFPERKR